MQHERPIRPAIRAAARTTPQIWGRDHPLPQNKTVHNLAWRAIASVSFAIWIYLALFRGRFWQLREKLSSASPSQSNIQVTAIIPARDEAGYIERAVAALRASNSTAHCA